MTEKEAFNDPEMKTILVLSGYIREINEGADYEETTYKTAETIVKIFAINWVAIEDEMPPENAPIFIYGKGVIFEQSEYNKTQGFKGRFTEDVTHWMHLPKPPCFSGDVQNINY